jgi:hypothetical protein
MFVRDIGIVLGVVGFFLHFQHIFKNPTPLKFDVWSCIHYYDQRTHRTNIEATLRIDNVNDHGTTIKEIQINAKTPLIESIQSYKKLVSIPSHATTQFRVSWRLPGVKLKDPEIDMSLKVSTTHSEGIIVPVVSKLGEIDSLTESENV